MLSLIHVKGAKSDSPDRGISVSSYEVVVGQAVKNLRHLDRLHLEEGLATGVGKKISQLVWHDRQPSNRAAMIEALGDIGTSYRRLVVILQPHVLRTRVEAVRKDPQHADVGRLQQLDTLLLSARLPLGDRQRRAVDGGTGGVEQGVGTRRLVDQDLVAGVEVKGNRREKCKVYP